MSDFRAMERRARSGESIVIRSCQATDAAALLRYFRTIGTESRELTFGAEAVRLFAGDDEAQHVERMPGNANSLMLVATLHNEIVGTLTLTGGAKAPTANARDIGVSVLQGHWNKGIARHLFDALFIWAMDDATSRELNLRVHATNTAAATLYACLGFGVEGKQSPIAIVDGRFDASLQMGMCFDSPRATDGAIRRATSADVDAAWMVVDQAAQALHAQGVHQWHQNYPTRDTIQEDIRQARLFALEREGRIDAVVTLNDDQDPLWATLPWSVHGRALVVHRLCVRPSAQRGGLGRRLMSFAETIAEVEGARCVRLDAYSENPDALRLYERRGYRSVGSLHFPHRVAPFVCFERPTRWSAPAGSSE